MATYRFRRSKPGRTPQETRLDGEALLEELLLVGGERRLDRFLHCGDSTTNRGAVKSGRACPIRHELVRDVQRGHDRDALVAHHLARVAHFLQLAVEVVRRRE